MVKQLYETISGITALNQSGPGSNGNETKALGLDPHHQMGLYHIQDTHWGGYLIPLQRCSWCILQSPQILKYVESGQEPL